MDGNDFLEHHNKEICDANKVSYCTNVILKVTVNSHLMGKPFFHYLSLKYKSKKTGSCETI